jgi:hypothetical protein
VCDFVFAGCPAHGVALSSLGVLERFGVAAAAAFHSLEFVAGRQISALVTASEVTCDFEVNNHRVISFVKSSVRHRTRRGEPSNSHGRSEVALSPIRETPVVGWCS